MKRPAASVRNKAATTVSTTGWPRPTCSRRARWSRAGWTTDPSRGRRSTGGDRDGDGNERSHPFHAPDHAGRLLEDNGRPAPFFTWCAGIEKLTLIPRVTAQRPLETPGAWAVREGAFRGQRTKVDVHLLASFAISLARRCRPWTRTSSTAPTSRRITPRSPGGLPMKKVPSAAVSMVTSRRATSVPPTWRLAVLLAFVTAAGQVGAGVGANHKASNSRRDLGNWTRSRARPEAPRTNAAFWAHTSAG